MTLHAKKVLASAVCTLVLPTMVLAGTRPASSNEKHAQAPHPVVVHNALKPIKVSVQSGDTLWSLARRYGVSVTKLEQWNHLTDQSVLQIGQKLTVGWSSAGSAARSVPLSGRSAPFGSGSAAGAVLGERIAEYAQQFVGVPYRWGGESASGFDCSGLVQFTFAHFGISVGRSSFDQYQEGIGVSRSDLLPGDLVFFNAYGSGPSHVGIYVGGGRFVNAASGGVRVDSLDDGYWASHYVGARRIQGN
ncbi:MAG: C40 family peptidase [Alicyclobacillus sp.]|nr:C40 family peptidase [Alicyclobacillus sp.]